MEEREYRETYNAVNERRCVFEKTINSRRSTCSRSRRFHLADREGIACTSDECKALCSSLLDTMRRNARFALHCTSAAGPLPHAREIKVQTGGMLGLQTLIYPEREGHAGVTDIFDIIQQAQVRYGDLEQLPFDIINQSIVHFEGRRKRTPPNRDR